MKFSRWVFRIAGIYGVLVILPQYFMETKLGVDYPPAITHPEYFYGFVGVALAWQLAFLMISQDPARYRWLMIPSALEKILFAVAAVILYLQGRAAGTLLIFAGLDVLTASLFLVSFQKCRNEIWH